MKVYKINITSVPEDKMPPRLNRSPNNHSKEKEKEDKEKSSNQSNVLKTV